MDEMGKQVKELREYAEYLDWVGAEKVMKALITEAADSIEALSAKLTAANMERSDRHYGEEKKLIEELAEEIENCYGRETELSERARDYLLKTDYGGGWIACEDRLPDKIGKYIIHVITGTGEDYVGMWLYERGHHLSGRQYWIDDKQGYWASPYNGDPINEPLSKNVIAWQPLPEPYRP